MCVLYSRQGLRKHGGSGGQESPPCPRGTEAAQQYEPNA